MTFVVLYSILWSIWRRVFGGWLRLPRALLVVLGIIFVVIPFIPSLGYYAVFTGLIPVLYWTPGHTFDNPKKVLLRYGPFGYVYTFWIKHWNNSWNRPQFIDGAIAVAELSIGFLFGLTIGSVIIFTK